METMLVWIKVLEHFWGTALGQGKRLILSLFSMMMTYEISVDTSVTMWMIEKKTTTTMNFDFPT